LTSSVALAASPPPWQDPIEAWRYVGDRVWTGEAFIYSRRTQPEPEIRASATPQNIEDLPGSGGSQGVEAPQGAGSPYVSGGKKNPGGSREPIADYRSTLVSLEYSPLTLQLTAMLAGNSGTAYDAASKVSGTAGHAVNNPMKGPSRSSSAKRNAEFQFTGWDDEAKRMLYLWKAKNKKGYRFFLRLFPGETKDSLQAAWVQYRKEAEQLYREREADESDYD